MRPTVILVFVVIVLSGSTGVADESTSTATNKASAFIDTHCVACHTADDKAGGLSLEQFSKSGYSGGRHWDTTVWEKITRRLRTRQMPPPDADRPTEEEYKNALIVFEGQLAAHAKQSPYAGKVDPIRRLNRTEYQNVIRDLLGVNIDAAEFLPADQEAHGFDNVTLGELPPLLLNRYIAAAEKIARIAVGGRERSPGGKTIRLPADRSQEDHVPGLPLGTRGGTVFEYQFTQTGEYEIQLRLMRDRDEKVEGLNGTYNLDVLIDRGRVHRFTVDPPKKKGNWAQDYTLVDAHLKKRIKVEAGPHQVGITFPRKSASLAEIHRQPFAASFNRHRHPRKAIALYEVSIVGPFDPQGPGDTPSRKLIYGEHLHGTQDEKAAEAILTRLVRRAYRRDVGEEDVAEPMKFFRDRFASDGFDAAMESAVASVLVNPHFLFRVEKQAQTGTVVDGVHSTVQISPQELASRLSFFLWSSLPDDELLDVAGQLGNPDVLAAQVKRMLADPRSDSLVDNFASQWLYLRNLESLKPDMRLFTDFDDNLRHALRQETALLFKDVVRKNRSVLDLISTDTTFLNERLAKHYGVPHVVGSHFRPVKVEPESHRGGILRHGSVLAVTSYATRTSPTLRGNWILENIIGTPPPPPPANVPALKEKSQAKNLTVRERLAEHRSNPACASCHNLMDPIGFALENFDAVGRWRVFEGGQPIDSSGALPDGQKIDSVTALEQGIIERPEVFVETLVTKLMTFGLGRGIEPADGPAIRKIVNEAAKADYAFSAIITEIVNSTPFRLRGN